jgi:predicted O-methyltransferase YrrM
MLGSGFKKDYVCIDTFQGFTADDISAEEARGKKHQWYDRVFKDNKIEWFKDSLRRRHITDIEVIKSDISAVNPDSLPQKVAFCLVDVDLYRPVKSGLEIIFPRLSAGGIIVVDDCWSKANPLAEPFDGALQAYREFIANHHLPEHLVETKLGVIKRD